MANVSLTPTTALPTLYALRTQAGYRNQHAMAVRLGVHGQTYGEIERGKMNPSPRLARKLARVLRVPAALLEAILQGTPVQRLQSRI
jgi:DNA-binding XRE family transcriptional regulator